jgi:hypothetical protein
MTIANAGEHNVVVLSKNDAIDVVSFDVFCLPKKFFVGNAARHTILDTG